MEEKKIKQLEKFINKRLPELEKKRVIMIIENKPLNWINVLEELKKKGKFSRKVEERFEEIIK